MKKKTKAIIILAIAAMVLALIFTVFILIKNTNDKSPGLKLQTDFGHTQQKKTKAPAIKITGVTSISFDETTKTSYTKLTNPKGNPCYFKFVMKIKETGQVVYESDYVKPGKTIQSEVMTADLKKGIYEGVLEIQTRELEKPHESMNGLNTNLSIIVN
ncbi:hypothetical protein ACAW68_11000 [Weissella confusa]|uniref:hypothetical protein n=1 Tax=Weissella confusa TaxID=1583 RepID=UPI0035A3373B